MTDVIRKRVTFGGRMSFVCDPDVLDREMALHQAIADRVGIEDPPLVTDMSVKGNYGADGGAKNKGKGKRRQMETHAAYVAALGAKRDRDVYDVARRMKVQTRTAARYLRKHELEHLLSEPIPTNWKVD